MKEVNYIDFTKESTAYFTNYNEAIEIKKETHLSTSIYQFKEFIGDGSFTKIETDDFSIEIIDVKLAKDLIVKTQSTTGFLEFSYLLAGEQTIKTNTKHGTIIYKADQFFLTYITDFIGTYHFSSAKQFKEIRIRISKKMMTFLDINQEEYNIHNIEDTFVKKTKETMQKHLITLIDNKLHGATKIIFMKGKIAELLAIYLNTNNSKSPFCSILNSVNKSKEIIIQNLDKQLTSKYIANEICINEVELKQNFKNTTGLSIQKFSTKIKMEKAKQLLKLTEFPIYQIAEETGYKNATHFTTAFKKNTGMLPKEYRSSVPNN